MATERPDPRARTRGQTRQAPQARQPRRGRPGPGSGRRRASHSLEAVISESVALLDEAGESALTFRALAGRLGGGVASIYWYVDNKDDLIARAANQVLASVLAETEQFTGSDDPIEDVRGLAVTFFDATADRPWLGAHFTRESAGQQPNELLLYERIGQQVMRLGLSAQQSFHAVSAVVGFVVGVAADVGQQSAPAGVDRDVADAGEQFESAVDQWRGLDPQEFPFIHFIVEEFATHDDKELFRAGLDLLLAGLRQQAEG